MKVKDTIFGSGPEKLLYKTLEPVWQSAISLYPSLPFLSVIDWSGARLTSIEQRFLKNTSVDYTACDRTSGRPLLSVEFDGMGHGYSNAGTYIEMVPSSDPNRRAKIELKLRMAKEVGYPLYVVSYPEADPITSSDELTVTHAIVGRALAGQHFQRSVREAYLAEQQELEKLPAAEYDEAVSDLIDGVSVQLSHEWDPMTRLRARLEAAAWDTGLVSSMSFQQLLDPPLSSGAAPGLANAFDNAHRVGARATVERRPDNSKLVREAWVRNVEDWLSSWLIAEDIANIRVCRALLSTPAQS